MEQCINLNGIIGGNGRIGMNNSDRKNLKFPLECGIRKSILVDFVGHLWCFKKDWLYYMFSIKPFTYDTGEDMHLCFTSKLLGNISSYVAEQSIKDDRCDIYDNKLANDEYSSYKTTSSQLRSNIEKYFIENYKLKLITNN
jgi:hypothetical protein